MGHRFIGTQTHRVTGTREKQQRAELQVALAAEVSTVQPETLRVSVSTCACAHSQARPGHVCIPLSLHGLGQCDVAAFCSISRAFSC